MGAVGLRFCGRDRSNRRLGSDADCVSGGRVAGNTVLNTTAGSFLGFTCSERESLLAPCTSRTRGFILFRHARHPCVNADEGVTRNVTSCLAPHGGGGVSSFFSSAVPTVSPDRVSSSLNGVCIS